MEGCAEKGTQGRGKAASQGWHTIETCLVPSPSPELGSVPEVSVERGSALWPLGT